MLFSSLTFLFGFLPILLLGYYVVPSRKFKNCILLVFSLLFYAWGEPVYIVLMLFSTVVDYINGGLAGYFVNRDNKKAAKIFVFLSVIINLSLLGIFKYIRFYNWNME